MQWSLAFVVMLGGDGDARAVQESGAVFAEMASCVVAGMRLRDEHSQAIEEIKTAFQLRGDYVDEYRSLIRSGLETEEAHSRALAHAIDGAAVKEWFANARAIVDKYSLDGPTLSQLANDVAAEGINPENMDLVMPTAEIVQRIMLSIPEVAALDWPRIDDVRRGLADAFAMVSSSGMPDRLDSIMTRSLSPLCLPTKAPVTQ